MEIIVGLVIVCLLWGALKNLGEAIGTLLGIMLPLIAVAILIGVSAAIFLKVFPYVLVAFVVGGLVWLAARHDARR
jgi:hypothetical protein